MDLRFKGLPPCRIKEHPRAKRVILRLLPQEGLLVVVPKGFGRQQVAEIIAAKRQWLEEAWVRVKAESTMMEPARDLPQIIHLAAIDQEVRVHYEPGPPETLRLFEVTPWQITVQGTDASLASYASLLQQWLKQQGRRHLLPWLHRLSLEVNLPYQQAWIRSQKSRWGSCSGRGHINLNCKLLFLQPELVRYIMCHELCHTVHLNHGPGFYQMLATLEPRHRELRQQVHKAWREVPWWAK